MLTAHICCLFTELYLRKSLETYTTKIQLFFFFNLQTTLMNLQVKMYHIALYLKLSARQLSAKIMPGQINLH